MAIDNSISTVPGLHATDKPWNEHHDIDATQDVVQKMLSGGTPNWVKWPEDYKN